jgi:hypothetical protein
MHASKMLCRAPRVVEALSWNRGWVLMRPRSRGQLSRICILDTSMNKARRKGRGCFEPRPVKETSGAAYGNPTMDFSVVSVTFVSVPAPPPRESLPLTP